MKRTLLSLILIFTFTGCAKNVEVRIVQSAAILANANDAFISSIDTLNQAGQISDETALRLLNVSETLAENGIILLDLSEALPESKDEVFVAVNTMIDRIVLELEDSSSSSNDTVRSTLLSIQSALTAIKAILEINYDAAYNLENPFRQHGRNWGSGFSYSHA